MFVLCNSAFLIWMSSVYREFCPVVYIFYVPHLKSKTYWIANCITLVPSERRIRYNKQQSIGYVSALLVDAARKQTILHLPHISFTGQPMSGLAIPEIRCRDPGSLANMIRSSSDSRLRVGTHITYICVNTYRFTGEDRNVRGFISIQCQSNGQWNREPPSCEGKPGWSLPNRLKAWPPRGYFSHLWW